MTTWLVKDDEKYFWLWLNVRRGTNIMFLDIFARVLKLCRRAVFVLLPTRLPSVYLCVLACRWLGMASKDMCIICEKPFYGKQKSIHCGECDMRFHCTCMQSCVPEANMISSVGKSTYKCDSCKKLLGDAANEHSLSSGKKKDALSTESQCTASCRGDKDSLIVQLEAVHANGISTKEVGTVSSPGGLQAQQ
jgi:hypothetical protein